VLSEDLVLFLKRDTPCLELCRVTTSPRRTGNINGDDAPPASLRVMRTLALPNFHPDYRVHTAYMQTDGYCPRHQQQRQRPARAPSPLTFHSAPEDMVVGITFLLRLRGPHPSWQKVVTTISHRALFALADVDTGTGRTMSRYDEHDCGDGIGEGEHGQEEEDGVGEEVVVEEVVPWEAWGPRAARVISPPTFNWITAHAGQRWLSLENDQLVIRDFSTARVRLLRARASACASTADRALSGSPAYLRYNNGNGTENETASVPVPIPVPRLAPAQTRILGSAQNLVQGGWRRPCFEEDVVSELPFIETRVDARGRVGDMVLTDGERLISFVRMGRPPTFEIYVLEDEEEEQEQGVQVERTAATTDLNLEYEVRIK